MTRKDVDCILGDLKAMGMGGAHIHSRTGMDLPYLSPEFMKMVRYSHQKMDELGMLTWLYDEDRFPSGAAGGLVTKDWKFRQRYLVLSPQALPLGAEANAKQRVFLGKYKIKLENGCLAHYQFFAPDVAVTGEIWYLYREIAQNNAWFNNQAYVDTLSSAAIDEFIAQTHEAYYKEFGADFGSGIPAIFTDEPQFCPKSTLRFAAEKKSITLPFTDDFPQTYQETYGCDFFESLPECIWELPGGALSTKRYYYHDHICARFVSAFADNIGHWCKKHHIALTGHMMEEPTLASQTAVLGEAMRSYRSFDLPGIDMLYDGRELNTAKQAQSAVHQFGAQGMMSELYGVTNWDFDFRGHKLAGDWQAALGVTLRVHHLTWTSMAGEAKRDYPASIGYQSPWYRQYHLIEDYFARLNTALTRGKCEVKVAVVHPIESYWLYWGPREQTQARRSEMDRNFKDLTDWLLFGLIDFDFISESLWEELTPESQCQSQAPFAVGKMQYDIILVPNCVTLRKTTFERLKAFSAKGGRVVFAGDVPTYMDGAPSGEVTQFAKNCERVNFTNCDILDALEPARLVDIRSQQGSRTDNLLSQIRQDAKGKWLFLAHCNRMPNPDLPKSEALTITLKGHYKLTLYQAMTGEIKEISYAHQGENTIICETVYDHDSLLYYLEPQEAVTLPNREEKTQNRGFHLSLADEIELALEEPNVLLLDTAQASLDGEPWGQKEEILRLDNQLRQRLGYPLRTEAFAQPWTQRAEQNEQHELLLRFIIEAKTEVNTPTLALENAAQTQLTLNGQAVQTQIVGFYTDRAIETIPLPPLLKGSNVLLAKMPYHKRFNLEAMYLLGDFDVKVAGKNTMIVRKNRRVAFGDICNQGLPFYGGNFTYRIPLEIKHGCALKIETTQYRAPLLGVLLDGESRGNIAFSPYSITLQGVTQGAHLLELKVYGSRINTFGALHNCNRTEPWPGHPNSYRTEGAAWAYEYQIRQVGILVSPQITCIEEDEPTAT